MASINVQIESTKYGGFVSYGKSQVSTLKPGIQNIYQKDIYNEISDYHSRKIPYFDDKVRFGTVYGEEYLSKIKESNFKNLKSKAEIKEDLNSYQYSHEPDAFEILKENTKMNEEAIRSK